MFSRINKNLKKRIEFRIALWYSAVFIVWSILLYIIITSLLYSSIRNKERVFIVEEIDEFVTIANSNDPNALMEELHEEIVAFKKLGIMLLHTTSNGDIKFSIIPDDWQSYKPEIILNALLQKKGEWKVIRGEEWFRDEGVADIGDTIDVTSRTTKNGDIIYLGQSSEAIEETLMRFEGIFGILLILMFIFGISGGIFLSWRVLRPLKELLKAVNRVETGDMNTRVPNRNTGDDLDELAETFNRMLEKIELLIKGMKEALDNVAHDLKTPMTRMRASIEKTIQADGDRESVKEALMDCAEESERVVNMLDTLMDISEAETGTMKLHMEMVSLFRLIENICDLYQYPAEDKNIQMSMSVPDDIYVRADQNRLYQVIANLVDNAVKYTPQYGTVGIIVSKIENNVEIRVEDSGPGISDEDVKRVFDRLYRGDKSRSQRGLGLGLSLVKAVIHAHNGEINVVSLPDKGACFTIKMSSE